MCWIVECYLKLALLYLKAALASSQFFLDERKRERMRKDVSMGYVKSATISSRNENNRLMEEISYYTLGENEL